MEMVPGARQDDAIDVVMRVPRTLIEERLLADPVMAKDPSRRRLDHVRAILRGRLRRKGTFQQVRFSDPSWDMILELYVARREQRALAVSQLCELSGTSMTTALRHIENMEALGYLSRAADPGDRRRVLVAVLPALVTALEGWLDLQTAANQLGC